MNAATDGATAEIYRQKAHAYFTLSLDPGQCERRAGLLHLAAHWQHLAETVERGCEYRRMADDSSPAPARRRIAPLR